MRFFLALQCMVCIAVSAKEPFWISAVQTFEPKCAKSIQRVLEARDFAALKAASDRSKGIQSDALTLIVAGIPKKSFDGSGLEQVDKAQVCMARLMSLCDNVTVSKDIGSSSYINQKKLKEGRSQKLQRAKKSKKNTHSL